MRDHRDHQAVLLGDLRDAGHQVGQRRQRHPDVLEQQRSLGLDRGDGEPARRDEGLALVGVGRAVHLRSAVIGEHARHVLGVLGAGGAAIVGRRDHQRGGVAVQAHLQLVLDRVDGDRVHELEHRRPDLAGDRDDGIRCGGHRVERRDDRAALVLRRQESQRHLRDHAKGALAADEQLRQAQSRNVFQPRPTEAHGGAVGQHHLHAEHVVGRDAVLHAAQAACVGRDVAADAADLVRRRVGWVPQPVLGDGLLDLGVEQPRLCHGGAGHGVDDDVTHPLGRQHDAAVQRGRTTRETRARAAGYDGHPMLGGPSQHRLDLLGPARPDHGDRGTRVRVGGAVLPV